ncbi:hypothetical protein RND81_12G186400 [Saponaria officinalis]|uniref:Uncharacterized protein n=1 Tax=Saponaria officinalis TaxID=3572 RepID=A0AAW1HCK9_SAPOF
MICGESGALMGLLLQWFDGSYGYLTQLQKIDDLLNKSTTFFKKTKLLFSSLYFPKILSFNFSLYHHQIQFPTTKFNLQPPPPSVGPALPPAKFDYGSPKPTVD